MRKSAAAALIFFFSYAGGAVQAQVVSDLRVEGNQRVESALILQKISSEAGQSIDAKKVSHDIKEIFSLGFFKDVSAELDESDILTFKLKEKPALREWRMEGHKDAHEDDLREAVKLKSREILMDKDVNSAADAILAHYREKGFYLAKATPEIIPLENEKNQVDVVYHIDEGGEVRVKDLNLMGTKNIKNKELKKYVSTRPAGSWSWLTSSGQFKEADLERDLEVIRAYYMNQGYIEASVNEPLVTLSTDRQWLKIDIPIDEGNFFNVGEIVFSGDIEFTEKELMETAGLKTGETFKSDDFRKGIQNLETIYGDLGYAFARIDPATRINREKGVVDIDFIIAKKELAHIGRIQVKGNTKTRDRIVRREMGIAEGDLYNGTKINKSKSNIQKLGFFEMVGLNTKLRPETSLVDIEIEVEEKPTGSFTFGAGYSSVDRVMGMANVSQRNFLGYAYQLGLSANFGSTRETYNFTFNNPRIFDSSIYGGVDFYKSIRAYSDYDKDAIGSAYKVGTSLGENWRTRWIYRLEEANVKNVNEDASSLLKRQEGITVTSSLTSTLAYDSRDNPWDPQKGTSAEWSVEWAGGFLKGDSAFLKYGFDFSNYKPLWWEHVLVLHSRIGFVHSMQKREIPVFERYYLGGITSLRGFDSRSVGPVDDETGDVIGGDKELLFNIEYMFPLIKEAKVRGVVFYDAGNAWDHGEEYLRTKLRTSAGAGIRWFSPLGPLRIEWGYNLDPEPGEDSSQWEFTIGGFF